MEVVREVDDEYEFAVPFKPMMMKLDEFIDHWAEQLAIASEGKVLKSTVKRVSRNIRRHGPSLRAIFPRRRTFVSAAVGLLVILGIAAAGYLIVQSNSKRGR
ncbi:hypothetical protein Lesp01_72510 [Lentzea sp. NBRC 102530]|nr:hypothetical protein Lesp01_72510 [Lentzea sp. NBRC 102530]